MPITKRPPRKDRSKEIAQKRERRRTQSRLDDYGPDCLHPEEREDCRRDLEAFALRYFPRRFPLAFSDDHRRMLGLLQATILDGGQFAVAMPRGSGKTTVMETAAVWAMLYGHRRFIFVVGADKDAAIQITESIRQELADNDLLLEDFAAACVPIAALEGISRRAEGQAYADGTPTKLEWTKVGIRLPSRSMGGGSVMRAAGITGRIRGAKASLADGSQVRPDLVLVDDPQTDESARSASQVERRMGTINGTILGLGGPGQRIAALCACTVIQKGDAADQLLDRKASPGWQGFTGRLMVSMPSNTKLWDEYAEILSEDLRLERGTTRATAFYSERREAMDLGAQAAWAQRHEPGELSAIQHAMTIRIIRGETCFQAEYQNAPPDPAASGEVRQITTGAVLAKCNGLEKYAVPVQTTLITVGIDVQRACLPWLAVGWGSGFCGEILAYGAEPEQGRPYWTLREVEKDLLKTHAGASWQAALHAGLEVLVERIAGREWLAEDGRPFRVDQIIIDAGYGESTDTVHEFCRRSRHSAILRPYFGKAIRPGEQPLEEWVRKPGDQVGPGWRIPRQTRRATRAVLADASAWKSFVAERILSPVGDLASLGVFGRAPEHRMLADQLSAETRTRVSANGRSADIWTPKPNRDNHWLDCLSMAAIGASIRGLRLDPHAVVRRPPPEPGPNAEQEPASPVPIAPPPKPAPKPLPRRPTGGGWLKGYGSRL